jgi:pantoate--beta-alanine ligase
VAYFGQKDLSICRHQPARAGPVVSPAAGALPIVREPDGLAMSSRNRRLEPEARKVPRCSLRLKEAEEALQKTQSAQVARDVIGQIFYPIEGVFLEYFEVVDAATLQPVATLDGPAEVALCIAAYVGEVRLIDNLIMARGGGQ